LRGHASAGALARRARLFTLPSCRGTLLDRPDRSGGAPVSTVQRTPRAGAIAWCIAVVAASCALPRYQVDDRGTTSAAGSGGQGTGGSAAVTTAAGSGGQGGQGGGAGGAGGAGGHGGADGGACNGDFAPCPSANAESQPCACEGDVC